MTAAKNTTIIWLRGYGWQFVNGDIFTAFMNISAIDFYTELILNFEYNRN
jgi:hypothetical protein